MSIIAGRHCRQAAYEVVLLLVAQVGVALLRQAREAAIENETHRKNRRQCLKVMCSSGH
jgi:hypothetical protein